MSMNTATSSRLKGIIWVVGAIAAIVTVVLVAPVISHLG